MKLFKLICTVNRLGYYHSSVVVAQDKEDALTIHPDGVSVWNGTEWGFTSGSFHPTPIVDQAWPSDLSKINVEYLGEADSSISRGVVISVPATT